MFAVWKFFFLAKKGMYMCAIQLFSSQQFFTLCSFTFSSTLLFVLSLMYPCCSCFLLWCSSYHEGLCDLFQYSQNEIIFCLFKTWKFKIPKLLPPMWFNEQDRWNWHHGSVNWPILIVLRITKASAICSKLSIPSSLCVCSMTMPT
jgi:hypothetical protein